MSTLSAIMIMLSTHSAPTAVPAKELAPAIIYAALRHDVDPKLLTRILLVESRGISTAVNTATDDHGLMQINKKTQELYGISDWCVKIWQCNLDKAALILSEMPEDRTCRYNVGTRRIIGRLEVACLHYERKLASIN